MNVRFLIVLTLASFFFFGCDASIENDIEGTWTMVNSTDPNLTSMTLSLLGDGTYTYEYTRTNGSGNGQTLEWEVKSDKLILHGYPDRSFDIQFDGTTLTIYDYYVYSGMASTKQVWGDIIFERE